MNKCFIESPHFPIDVVNIASAREKGPGRPPYWEMVFWWTRKPLAASRAVILASLLPEDFTKERFLKIAFPNYTGRSDKPFDKTPHYTNPRIDLLSKELGTKIRNAKLLDPFAGFGSIPLEAIRLGMSEVVAIELLPTAVVFLRAILEYPVKYGKQLVEDVKKWGEWVIYQLRRDPDIQELYDPDVAVYIGTWEVKCPYCGKYTPLIGNWWLARVKDKKGYKALAWMKPRKTEQGIEIEVVDLSSKPEELVSAKTITKGSRTIGVKTSRNEYRVGDEKLGGEPNIDARRQEAICLNCYARIKGTRDKWYVKESLRKWNEDLEKYLEGEITLDQLLESPARPRILVKVKIINRKLVFESATVKDSEKLWEALEKLKQIWGDPDIPTEPIPEYESRSIWVYPYGFDKWFKLFNPRQLLTLLKLVKLIREAGKKIEGEKLRGGWSREEAFKYAEAVTTYLAIALVNFVRHNALVNHWEGASWQPVRHSLAMRGIAMQWNWCDANPYHEESLVSYQYFNSKNVDGLSYLVSAVSGSSSKVRVIRDDATRLDKLVGEKFDLIVTDPPYRDDVAYSELSDFYYVWLKRALSNNDGISLKPRFHTDCFFQNGVEVRTQWEWFSSREVSLSIGRCKYFELGSSDAECENVYRRMLADSFKAMASKLKDNGLLVTFFAQSSPLAWASLIHAGINAGLYVTSAFPVITESEESVVARGKAAITSSIVVVWRKKTGKLGDLDISLKRSDLVEEIAKFIEETEKAWEKSLEPKLRGVATYVMVYAYALSLLTRYDRVVEGSRVLSVEEIAHRASLLVAQAYALGSKTNIKSEDSVFYYIVKRVFPRSGKGMRRLASSSDLILLGYGFGTALRDEKQYARILDKFVRAGILKPYGKEKETEVASRKTYILLEPVEVSEASIAETLKLSGVDPLKLETIRNPVQALHVLMLYSLRPIDVFKKKYEDLYSRKPGIVAEAVELAKALSTIRDDPEAILASRVLEYLGKETPSPRRGTLDEYFKS
ncbi:MAG: DUF1156 domain-containing protein [Thermoprotei archaeon]